jgi:Cd2+/Zn2+-exporting ATPase
MEATSEPRLKINLPLLLPEVKHEQDACVERLRSELETARGISHAHVTRHDGEGVLCLHYNPQLVTLEQVRRTAERAGAQLTRRYRHENLRVRHMDCADCGLAIEHILRRKPGVLTVSVNPAAERMRIEYDTRQISRREIVRTVRAIGFEIDTDQADRFWNRHGPIALSLLGGLLLAVGFAGEHWLGFAPAVVLGLYLLSYLAGGWEPARHGIAAALRRHFDIDFLMVLAAVGAAYLGAWAEGAFLLFLFSLGHALEHSAMDKARRAIESLSEIAPRTGRVRRDGMERELDIEEIQVGDVALVRAGERIPVDGSVLAGRSAVDQSPVTGESQPVDKIAGDRVFAGTINGSGTLEVKVEALASESTLAHVIQMVAEAQTQKSPTQRFADRFEKVFVPAVLVSVVTLIALPALVGWLPFSESLRRGLTLLVAASPCALAIATPSAMLAGIAQAARSGVLIKGGAHLEALGRLRALAFDKTGTLTAGKPAVTDVIPLDGLTPDALLRLTAAVESRSQHPLARAVVQHAAALPPHPHTAEQVETLEGLGIQAQVGPQAVRIGRLSLFAGTDTLTPNLEARVADLEAAGKTTMLVEADRHLVGLIALADQPRPAARRVIERLRRLGVSQTALLTGDNPRAAQAVCSAVGVSSCQAALLPADKVAALKQLEAEWGSVGMVGDGINDAPALAAATVGIAMGGAGSAAALETADVALMADDLEKLPFAIGLSRQANRIVRQNLVISLGTVAVLLPFAVLGLAGIGPAIFFHEGSTIVVVLNALRLLAYREP